MTNFLLKKIIVKRDTNYQELLLQMILIIIMIMIK